MLTPASALNWEIRRTLRLPLLWTFLATLLIPGIALTERVHARLLGIPIQPEDLVFSPHVQLVITIMNLVFCIVGILQPIGFSVREYALPVTSQALAAVRMLYGAVSCAVIYLLSSTLVNILFETQISTFGPALTYGVAYMVMYATIARFRGNDSRLGLAGLLAAGVLLVWVVSHFGPRWGEGLDHSWPELTAKELVVLVAVGGLSWWSLVETLHRDRRGAGWGQIQATAAVTLARETGRYRTARKFQSAIGALFWQEWKQDGLLVPGVVVALMVIGAGLHLVVSCYYAMRGMFTRPISLEVSEFATVSGALSLCAIIPWFLGLSGQHGKRVIRQAPWSTNLTTLPVSDAALGWIHLTRVLASSLLAALGAILVGILWGVGIHLINLAMGMPSEFIPMLPPNSNLKFYIAMYVANWFFGLWLTAGISSAATLTGRRWIASLPLTSIAVALFSMFAINFIMYANRHEPVPFLENIPFAILCTFLVGTVAAYVLGIMYDVIRLPTLLLGFGLFVAAEVILVTLYRMQTAEWLSRGLQVVTLNTNWYLFVALVAAPPALIPLAMYHNRHR